MDCDHNLVNGEADDNQFSIRQFVAATRRKDIFHCWPFPQKYLQICLKHGVSNVLPPFEPYNPVIRTTIETVGLLSSQKDKEKVSFDNKVIDIVVQEKLIEDECNSYYDEVLSNAPCHDCLKFDLDNSCKHKNESNLRSDYTCNVTVQVNQQSSSVNGSPLYGHQGINTVAPKRLRHKQRRHKRRQKKRSMFDILAKAKPCTLEDIYVNRCNSINLTNNVDDSSRVMAGVEDVKDNDEASMTICQAKGVGCQR